jgi:uncharacterized protein (DUF305 family)
LSPLVLGSSRGSASPVVQAGQGSTVSLLPHHSRAILVCQEADITDPEIIRLCEQIVESRQQEIAQMEEILGRY